MVLKQTLVCAHCLAHIADLITDLVVNAAQAI